MNQNFDFKHFMLVLRWNIFTTKKNLIQTTLGLTFVLAFIVTMTNFTQCDNGIPAYAIAESSIPLVYITLFMFYYIMGTQLFSNIRTKAEREQYFMLPASNLEKYLARLSMAVVGTFAIIIASIVMADILQFIASFLIIRGAHFSITSEYSLATYHFLSSFFTSASLKGFTEAIPSACLLIMGLLSSYAFCIFCGTLFRKHATLLTIATHMVLSMGSGFLIGPAIELFDFSFDAVEAVEIAYATSFFLLMLTIGFYYGSYKIFTHMQVISNKWLNIQ